MDKDEDNIYRAICAIKESKYTVAFTGAGISVESGIPPFRGPGGLWSKYNPMLIEINYFRNNPRESWEMIKKLFYDFLGEAKPNAAHYALASLERKKYLQSVITQNIDNLHQEAGSKNVYEYHGTTKKLKCLGCFKQLSSNEITFETVPPRCPDCGGVLKPEFVFFGEPIPAEINRLSFNEAKRADVMLVIGTTGEIMPASMIPYEAKESGCKIIEVNISKSNYTDRITDIFLCGKATDILSKIDMDIG